MALFQLETNNCSIRTDTTAKQNSQGKTEKTSFSTKVLKKAEESYYILDYP